MASGFFSILDDVAALMDDVTHTTQVATGKTAGVLGDDLAVNAEKATGFLAEQELPVLWAITKGSLLNKLIIVPLALLLSATFPVVIKVVLVLGGFYLAYEGAEKIVEYLFHKSAKSHEPEKEKGNHADAQQTKIKAAIRTDFVLSIEIVIIALGTVLEKSLMIQIVVVSIVSLLATIGVYGLVALIVRMDDAGVKLLSYSGGKGFLAMLGRLLVKSLPMVIRVLGFAGTVALLMVSGGILVHNFEVLHHLLPVLPEIVKEILAGFVAGLAVVMLVGGGKKLVARK